MVELRKRPARSEPAAAPPAKRSSSKSNAKSSTSTSKVKQVVNKAKEAVTGKPADPTTKAADDAKPGEPAPAVAGNTTGVLPETTGTAGEGLGAAPVTTSEAPANEKTTAGGGSVGDTGAKLGKESVGKKIGGEEFGGRVTTHEGRSVTLRQLLKEEGAKNGVVLFTYPKASTPGCTTQACLFRDNYTPLQAAGYAVYGLSTDSEKSNGNFVTKQGLPYPLLCDPNASLTSAIGMKKPGPGKSTTRGVVVVDKEGVVRVWEQAGPQRTLDVVLEFVKGS